MSPILRRTTGEEYYDPRKRRAAFLAQVGVQRRQQGEEEGDEERDYWEREREREGDGREGRDGRGRGDGGEQPLLSPSDEIPGTGNGHGNGYRSYGSDHSDDYIPPPPQQQHRQRQQTRTLTRTRTRTKEVEPPPLDSHPPSSSQSPQPAAQPAAPHPPPHLSPPAAPHHPHPPHLAAPAPAPPLPLPLHQALTLTLQSTPALLLSLTGLLFTGQLLDHLAVWSVFRRVDELFILVPVLGNLKGNLEMCLGARLGTSANRGHLDTPPRRARILLHAQTFLLLQALTISSIAGVLSFLLGLMMRHRVAPSDSTDPTGPVRVPISGGGGGGVDGPHREGYTPPGLPEFVLVVGTAMAAATLSSLILGTFMSTLIIVCRWCGVDPDNIASPLAATLGDLLTLFIMALVGTGLVVLLGTPGPVVLLFVMCALTGGVWWRLRVWAGRRRIRRGRSSRGKGKRLEEEEEDDEAEEGGWSPLIGAMLISSATGLVLDRSVNRYKGFAILAISITGIAGSIGAIHASRLSTALHAAQKTRHHRDEAETRTSSPLLGLPPLTHHHPPAHTITPTTTDTAHIDAPAALTNIQSGITLFLISWPIQGVFVAFVWMSGWIQLGGLLTFWVGVVYGVTVALSIYLAQVMTLFFWSKNLDPDSYTLPVHSSLIDLLGQIFLVIAFEVAARMGADVINVDGVK